MNKVATLNFLTKKDYSLNYSQQRKKLTSCKAIILNFELKLSRNKDLDDIYQTSQEIEAKAQV